ncbi:hypothetical protein O6027_13600 [Sphingomonas aerolata]
MEILDPVIHCTEQGDKIDTGALGGCRELIWFGHQLFEIESTPKCCVEQRD